VRLLAIVLLLLSSLASADPNPDAQRLLDEGTRLFTEDANHQAARDAFQRSYDLEPGWRALNGIALTYQEQGRFVDALATYEKLIKEFDAVLSDAQRTTVTGRIATLETRVAVVDLTANQPRVAVSIDSEEIGTGPLRRTIRLLPGRHVVVATLAGHQTLTKTIVLAPAEKLTLALTLETERVVVKVEQARLARRFSRRTPWLTLGSGAALFAIGGIFHAVSARDFGNFDDSVAATSGSPPMAVPGDAALRDRAVLERRLAIGSYVLGGLTAIAGAVLFGINQPRPIDVVASVRGVGMVVHF
jgi:hypothetical protein